MLIKSVDIQGFKSFADRTKLNFSKGLTAVVGPNGSGKSNVSDAVRWVLGEQSTKQLRGQSMEDVIFSGTDKRKGHGFCEVTINFDNKDRGLNFDNDSVSVTRRYYRSHESEYLINGNFVRLKDVHELFMDTGLGRDGYSMIGQGKIDNIVSSKSHERRDIFEEASGISRYRYRKEESERKLKLAEENLLRLKDIESELKGRIEPLKAQSEAATEFLTLSEEKKELEIGVWLHTLDESKETLRKQENKIAIATEQYNEFDRQITEIENNLDENSALFNELTAKIDTLRVDAGETDQRVARIEGDINVLKTSILFNQENIARIKEESEKLNISSTSTDEKIAEYSGSKAELKKELETVLTEEKDLMLELSSLTLKSENALKQKESISLRLNELAIKISEQRAVYSGAISAAAEIEQNKDTFKEKILKLKEEEQELKKELTLLNTDLDNIESEISANENAVKGYKIKREARAEIVEKINAEINELELKSTDAVRRAEMLTELDKNLEGFSFAVKEVLSAKDNKRLSGVEGVVSKLLKVDTKYATAIEIALGAAASNIIVEKDADAKRAISYLKEKRLGRATFLPIESLRPTLLSEENLDDNYGYVGKASELITYDKRYDSVFKWLLARTVITEDLDSAVAIAKKYNYKFKAVSLDGQVVNPGGSLTGGSVSKASGVLSRKDDIEKLKQKAEKLSAQIEEKKESLKQAALALAEIDANILNYESSSLTFKEDKIRVLGELKRVNELLENLKAQITSQEEERDNAQNRIASLKTEAENARLLIKECEEKQEEINKNNSFTDGEETAEKRTELGEKLTSYRLRAAELEKDISVLDRYIEDLNLGEEEAKSKKAELDRQIAEFENKNLELEQKIEEYKNDILNTKTEGSNFMSTSEDLANKRNSIEGSNVMLRQKQKEILADKEKASGEIARLNERKDVMLNELDEIIAKLYDEYELTKTDAENLGIKIENISEAKKRLSEIRSKIKSLGSVNLAAIEEYKEVSERYEFLSGQIADVENSKTELLKLIDDLQKQMKEMFLEGFKKIGENFTKTFGIMFGGGHAELKLSDPEEPLTSGIDIVALLPGKKVPSLDVLSGGEKALIAISIYFAIMEVNAPPFCFLDEVESALDDINVERFARYIKSSSLPTQFICITHRRGTMENADMLYGVTMQEKGVSKLIELNVSELEKQLKTL